MANIYCTNKMAKWLGSAKSLPENPMEYFWNANLFKIERKNWLICVHNPTAYTLFFSEIKKSDLKSFDNMFFLRLKEQMAYEGIDPQLANSFPHSPIDFYKTNNHKRIIGIMNSHVSDVKYSMPYWGGTDNISLLEINYRLNQTPIGPNPYTFPIEEVTKFLGMQN